MQIILHQTCNNCEVSGNSSFYDVGKDYFLPLIIAGVAAYMVYWAFVRETKRDRDKELVNEIQQQNDRLQFFSNLVLNAIRFADEQYFEMRSYLEIQTSKPTEIHLMGLVSVSHLRRFVEDLNFEVYLLAYVNHYKSDRKQAIREFNFIVSHIDLLYDIIKEIPSRFRQAQDSELANREMLQKIQLHAQNLVAKLAITLRRVNLDAYNEFLSINDQFSRAFEGHNSDITFYRDHFLKPFNAFALKYLSMGRVGDVQLQDLAITTRDGLQIYNVIVKENLWLTEDYRIRAEQVFDIIEKLKGYSKNLLADF